MSRVFKLALLILNALRLCLKQDVDNNVEVSSGSPLPGVKVIMKFFNFPI